MSEHLTEEEQIETFKRWWKEHGVKTLTVILAGIAIWYGWQQWQETRERRAGEASLVYLDMLDASGASADKRTDEQRTDIVGKANKLKSEYSGTQYARYAAFMLAKLAVEEGKLDAAADELQWVLDSDPDQGLVRIARLRLARVEAARGNLQQALDLLQAEDAGEMASAYAEVRGDIHMQQGDRQAAQDAYEEAISRATSADGNARQLLELKLNRVSPAGSENIKADNAAKSSPDTTQQAGIEKQ